MAIKNIRNYITSGLQSGRSRASLVRSLSRASGGREVRNFETHAGDRIEYNDYYGYIIVRSGNKYHVYDESTGDLISEGYTPISHGTQEFGEDFE